MIQCLMRYRGRWYVYSTRFDVDGYRSNSVQLDVFEIQIKSMDEGRLRIGLMVLVDSDQMIDGIDVVEIQINGR